MENQYQPFTATSDEFIAELKYSIDNNKPMSLSRIGDGEIAILKREPNIHTLEASKTWGYDNVMDLVEDMRKVILESIKHSDWLGVIGPTDFIQNWHKDGTVKDNWYLDKKYIEESGRIKPVKATDAFIPRSFQLGNVNELKKILKGTPIAIVSPETEGLKANGLAKELGCDINYISVPAGVHFNDRGDIIKKIVNVKEHVILIAWSVWSKDLSTLLYQHGKVSLDMGAVIATWAGRQTRWDFRKGAPHAHCFISHKS
tara:strand:+ start:3417 stop:4190 length:774 start_codon:yes stop_codon:yes gene_type:complete